MPRLVALAACLLLAAPSPAADPARYAVLVGVNRYEHAGLGPLDFAVADATELRDVLAGLGYKVTLLTDATTQKPTKANVDAALKGVLQAARGGDTVLIGLSGHGLQFGDDKNRAAYFCPSDGVPSASRTDTLVPLSDLYRELEDTRAGVKVLLVDACRNDPKATGGKRRSGVTVAAAAPPAGVAALFSCSRGQESLEHPALKHGVFFHHVIAGLRGPARRADGVVTFNSLADYVIERVAATARDLQQHTQTPNQMANIEGPSPVLATGTAAAAVTPAEGEVTDASKMTGPTAEQRRRAEADYKLAEDHYQGRNGRRKDVAEAARLYRRAADAGHPRSMSSLGYLYGEGLGGLAKDPAEELRWYRKAVAAGDPHGMANLGLMYEHGAGGLAESPAEAVKWYRKAAAAGGVKGMICLGNMYERGRGGLAADVEEAVKWYRKAVAAKSPYEDREDRDWAKERLAQLGR